MKTNLFTRNNKALLISSLVIFSSLNINAQTNVFDDIIAASPNHTYLEAAILQEGLEGALQTAPNVTVFAPDDAAFSALASALNTDINGLLALPNLSDILLYHVIGSSVPSNAVNNGDIAQPLSMSNTLKLTKTSGGNVYANQAMVNGADIMADNGYVHSLNGVLLPSETVVDIAIDNGFTSLATAVITAELLPALTNPLATYTVFAPTNQAFDDLATALGTDINGLLANPELADILLYHVLGSEVMSTDLTNGDVPTLNGQAITVDLTSGVMINSSMVVTADLTAFNGVVHVIDEVLVPSLASINDLNNVNISIYPNPTSSVVTIEDMDQNFNLVQLFDANGQKIKEQALNMNAAIDVSNLSTGRYTIVLQGQSSVATKNLQVVSNK